MGVEAERTVLLDTHVALWLLTDSPRLPTDVRQAVDRPGFIWIFHQVSTWEVQIKYQSGKLPLPRPPETFLRQAVRDTGLSYATIDDRGIFMLAKLPDYHRDPFDRLLVAHAAANGWEIASADTQIARYPVRIFGGG